MTDPTVSRRFPLDHRLSRIGSIHDCVADQETAEVLADPETLHELRNARAAVEDGDVVYGIDAVRELLNGRMA